MAERGKRVVPAAVMGPRLIFMLSAFALLMIGLVMVYSASAPTAIDKGLPAFETVLDQAKYALLGIVAAVVLYKFIPYRLWGGPFVWIVWGIGFILIVMTALFGVAENGAKRWLMLGPVSLQASEFFKIALILVAAKLMCDLREERIDSRTFVVQIFLFVLAPLLFMYVDQSDLGTTLICAVGILAVMWLGEVPLRYFAIIIGACLVFGCIAIFGSGYRTSRLVFLDPWNDGSGGYDKGYQIIRSFYAFSEGGLFGVGLGNSHEKFQYIYASDSDFIFSIIGEELGLLGALMVIALFLLLLWSGLRIARQSDDTLGAMIAGGCSIMMVGQAFLNMGSAMGVLPTTGKPLPFISAGGTALVATFIMVGIILSVSKAEGEGAVFEQRRADLRILRAEPVREAAPRSATAPRRSSGRARSDATASPRRAYRPPVQPLQFDAGGGRRLSTNRRGVR